MCEDHCLRKTSCVIVRTYLQANLTIVERRVASIFPRIDDILVGGSREPQKIRKVGEHPVSQDPPVHALLTLRRNADFLSILPLPRCTDSNRKKVCAKRTRKIADTDKDKREEYYIVDCNVPCFVNKGLTTIVNRNIFILGKRFRTTKLSTMIFNRDFECYILQSQAD